MNAIVDRVAHETARDLSKPGAEILGAWLAERIAGTDRAVIVLDENGRVPTIVRNYTSGQIS